ncbi:MAG: DUF4783 domain-containing protein [Bacteroidetes bacterium]|nr:DUF4783 domain-containing protein [Bacteroidota bacterium]
MKHFFTLIAASLLLTSFSVTGSIDEIITALKAGNASQIAKYFDNTVEITLPDKSNSYSKSQGEMILKDFFSNAPVKSFEVIHKGENAGSQYCIGTLVTANGTYRTTVFMKQKGDRQMVQEIRFESK